MVAIKQPVLAIFASDVGPGDAERSSLMSQTGALLAKKGAKLICLAQDNEMPLPAITSARAAGGEVELIADLDYVLPKALGDIAVQRLDDRQSRLNRLGEMADCFIGLPGSLASASNLYFAIAGLKTGKPIVLLNYNNAFEIVRGISVDVFAHSFPMAHKSVQFAETVEDIWAKTTRLLA